MFGDANTGASHYESCDCGDIKGSGCIASRATRIHQGLASGAACIEHGICADRDRSGGGADCFRESYYLFDGLTLHVQANEQSADLGLGALAGENFVHDRARLITRERLAVIHDSVQSFQDHVSARIVRQKALTVRISKIVSAPIRVLHQ